MTATRKTFHEELDSCRRDVVRLAAHVTEAIPRGTEVLLSSDLQGAQNVIDHDDVLDELSIRIEESCYTMLALQNPMAGDLREIITTLHLVGEIERSGDLVVNICKALRRVYPLELPPTIRGLIEQMSEQATRLYRMAMDAYDEGDAGLAGALDDIDDRLDDLHTAYIEEVLSWGADGNMQTAVQMALVGRYYERIGDHAVNIGQRVRYMVTGWLPEHAGAARVRASFPTWDDPAESKGPGPDQPDHGQGADGG